MEDDSKESHAPRQRTRKGASAAAVVESSDSEEAVIASKAAKFRKRDAEKEQALLETDDESREQPAAKKPTRRPRKEPVEKEDALVPLPPAAGKGKSGVSASTDKSEWKRIKLLQKTQEAVALAQAKVDTAAESERKAAKKRLKGTQRALAELEQLQADEDAT
jgi:hypothetical protein